MLLEIKLSGIAHPCPALGRFLFFISSLWAPRAMFSSFAVFHSSLWSPFFDWIGCNKSKYLFKCLEPLLPTPARRAAPNSGGHGERAVSRSGMLRASSVPPQQSPEQRGSLFFGEMELSRNSTAASSQMPEDPDRACRGLRLARSWRHA